MVETWVSTIVVNAMPITLLVEVTKGALLKSTKIINMTMWGTELTGESEIRKEDHKEGDPEFRKMKMLLHNCLLAFNEIPNTQLRGSCGYQSTYALAAEINRTIKP